MPIKVIVRDARSGRDPALITVAGGEVLAELEVERPYSIGDRLVLPDGSEVEMVGGRDDFTDQGWTQTVHVGTVWD